MLTVSVPVDATLANNLVTTNDYDAFGNVGMVTDAREYSTFSYYDSLGRVTLQSDDEEYITADHLHGVRRNLPGHPLRPARHRPSHHLDEADRQPACRRRHHHLRL